MKVLVTGSSGFLGVPTVAALKAAGHTVVPFDQSDGKDILDPAQLLAALKGCGSVVHLAAIPKPRDDRSFPDYFMINDIGTLNVANAAVAAGVKRLVFASSTSYYGIEKGIPFKKPVMEDNPIVPMYLKADQLECRDCDLAYSESKVIAENILAFYGLRKKLQVVILRFSAIGKTFLGTSVSVPNAVQGIVRAVEAKGPLWYEAFNIVDDIEAVSNEKAKRLLGYAPR